MLATADGSGLLPLARELLEPGERSEAEGEACGRGVTLVGGVSDRNDECDLRERSEARGSRPAWSRGELLSTSLSSLPMGEKAEAEAEAEGDEAAMPPMVERRYFAGSFLEMASASVCFLNLVSGLSAAGLMLDRAAREGLDLAAEGVGKPERKCELLGVVGMPDDMVAESIEVRVVVVMELQSCMMMLQSKRRSEEDDDRFRNGSPTRQLRSVPPSLCGVCVCVDLAGSRVVEQRCSGAAEAFLAFSSSQTFQPVLCACGVCLCFHVTAF